MPVHLSKIGDKMANLKKCPMFVGLQRAGEFQAQMEVAHVLTPEAEVILGAIVLIKAWHDRAAMRRSARWEYSRNNECGDGSRTLDLAGQPMHFGTLTDLYRPAAQVTIDGQVIRLTCTCDMK